MIGTKLAHYEITAHLGSGGMGDVYQATDLKLKRSVAIKLLPEAFSSDAERLSRFRREAQLLASLNHPNVAHIYGLEESGDKRCIVMELVEGETLQARLKRGPIPVDEALAIAKQICEALEAAHEKGVIHRDLKPGNVMLTGDGKVKVLDFGLAKAMESDPLHSDLSNSPTMMSAASVPGIILGTAAYMSPEQARGRKVDKRTDIFAFGCVLHEMLTGQRAFDGEDVSEILAHVLTSEPDWTRLPTDASPAIRKLLQLCLEKNAKNRRSDPADVRVDIEQALKQSGDVAIPTTAPAKTSWLVWIATAAVVASMILSYVTYRQTREPGSQVFTLALLAPDKALFSQGPMAISAISPNGRAVVFSAESDGLTLLWIKDLGTGSAKPLNGTRDGQCPFWSPDGRSVAFFSAGKLKTYELAQGRTTTLADLGEGQNGCRGGSWADGKILFGPGQGGLLLISQSGGAATRITSVDPGLAEVSHRWPSFLPDGKHFLYTALSTDFEKTTVYVGELNSTVRRKVIGINSNASFVPSGYLLFQRERTVMAQRFDPETARILGEPVPVAEGSDYWPNYAVGSLSASSNGHLIFSMGMANRPVQLTWVDRTGKRVGTLGPPGNPRYPAISPDSKTVVVDRVDNQTGGVDLWEYDTARGGSLRLTSSPGRSEWPLWTPDGARILFSSNRDGKNAHYWIAAHASSNAQLLNRADYRMWSMSQDGSLVVMRNGGEILTVSASDVAKDDAKPIPYLQTRGTQDSSPRLSPDGKWMTYSSGDSGRSEAYVQAFPVAGQRWQISTAGGNWPVWSRDGKEVFFVDADGKMMAVSVKVGKAFEASAPLYLFDVNLPPISSFDVSADGRFLIPLAPERSGAASITVLLNWQSGMK